MKHLPKRTREQRRARTLVPIISPPPACGDRSTHGAQASLSWDLVTEMARRARDVANDDGLRLSPERRHELHERNGVGQSTADRLWPHWREIGFIAEPEPGLIQLGPRHPEAWDLILNTGKLSNEAAEGKHPKIRRRIASKA